MPGFLEKEREQRASRNTRITLQRPPPEQRAIPLPATYAAGRSYAQAVSPPADVQPGLRPAVQQSRPSSNNASDFWQLAAELRKLNELCDIRSVIEMVKELNNKLTKDMDNLTRLQIMLDVTSQYSYE